MKRVQIQSNLLMSAKGPRSADSTTCHIVPLRKDRYHQVTHYIPEIYKSHNLLVYRELWVFSREGTLFENSSLLSVSCCTISPTCFFKNVFAFKYIFKGSLNCRICLTSKEYWSEKLHPSVFAHKATQKTGGGLVKNIPLRYKSSLI